MTLLKLPPEIRQQIWAAYYKQVARPLVRYACDMGDGIETSTEVDTNLAYTCKQIYAEAWPILLDSVQLHVIYMSHSPSQLAIPPPRFMRDRVREIAFHCTPGGIWQSTRPPRRPFQFHEFPRLETFRITKPMEFTIDELSDGARNVVMSESAYKELSPPERLAAWKNSDAISAEKIIQHTGEFGKGGWLSRIVDPQRFSEPLRLEPDSDSENDDSDWEEWSKDVPWDSSNDSDNDSDEMPKKKGQGQTAASKLQRCREAVARIRTVVELELQLCVGPIGQAAYPPSVIDILLVLVDTSKREIVDFRLLSQEEQEFREKWSREAS